MTTRSDLPRLPDLPAHRAAIETFVHLARIAMVTTDLGGQAYAGLRHDLTLLAQEAARRRPRHAVAVALADLIMADLAPDGVPDGPLRQARDDLVRGRAPRSQA
ncbi:hypothetical protein [Nocardioides sp. AX2bis]|uniref:hypothetical protein n=1 Tax=Nocardioides sp. AX2bis TaxID=2653157 RepID=UPI0012F30AAD|nr:hypothetical protein [Nocardioides sp. AX2bis]VXB67909.1 hypothetical protein NOCARDAX2BIS_30072 [Nocardioides sp. AX2bis]